ncbi:hypothetical protein FB451DRAFT_1409282 [Mycena latifolia]|nr:hypothetical protein FB451DRAFT_1409282 [Mycena latifolia]
MAVAAADMAIDGCTIVIRNWANAQAVFIPTRLREVATPTTKLVPSGHDFGDRISGAARPQAPPPLLPNWGVATVDTHIYDMTMHNLVGGVERTLTGFVDILEQAGWKLVRIHHCPPSPLSYLMAVPV